MDSGEVSRSRPVASPPLAHKGGHSGHRSHGRSTGTGPEPAISIHYYERVSSTSEGDGEFANIVSEVFKEDLAYRALARKFLWEFFD